MSFALVVSPSGRNVYTANRHGHDVTQFYVADDGKLVEMESKVGDIVIYSRYAGSEFREDGEDFLVLRESDILAKIT